MDTDRYSRQVVLAQFGPSGQERLLKSKVAVIGCGALGTHIASNLARAGIGHLLVMDRDLVELNNLQRQTLFDESDVGTPKVIAAARKLRQINSEIRIESLVINLHNENIEDIIAGVDLVIDATDNIPIRMIVNDACVKHGIPWIYTGVIRTTGMVMSIVRDGPCLRCILPEIPPVGSMISCEIAGVLNTIPAVSAAIECTEAFKILLKKDIEPKLIVYDIWEHKFNVFTVKKDRKCECCVKQDFKFLNAENNELILNLCDNSVQIIPARGTRIDLKAAAAELGNTMDLVFNEYLLRFRAEGKTITIFKDGRAIIKGTGDKGAARALYSRYLGL